MRLSICLKQSKDQSAHDAMSHAERLCLLIKSSDTERPMEVVEEAISRHVERRCPRLLTATKVGTT